LADTPSILWTLFVSTSLAITIIIVAFVAAMVLAQRGRSVLRQEQALLVARAHEEERAWVASELHDDALQRVALVCAELDALRSDGGYRFGEVVATRLKGINDELADLAVAIRRIAARLHPTIVDQVGLVPALEELAREVERGSEVKVQLATEGMPGHLPADTERTAYRIVQEALRNVVRHSAGRAATVTLTSDAHHLVLAVQDDGRGFDAPSGRRGGLGLASLRERALIVGGTLEVRSRPGYGTTVVATLPHGAH